jgi:DNA-binding YbaB/EbfC family protein
MHGDRGHHLPAAQAGHIARLTSRTTGREKTTMFDPKQLMQMQKQLQEQMATMQAERETKHYVASSGGGAVTATVNGHYQLLDLVVKPEAVDPDDIDLLQDLVVAAVNSAIEKARREGDDDVAKMTGGMKLPPFLTGGM